MHFVTNQLVANDLIISSYVFFVITDYHFVTMILLYIGCLFDFILFFSSFGLCLLLFTFAFYFWWMGFLFKNAQSRPQGFFGFNFECKIGLISF